MNQEEKIFLDSSLAKVTSARVVIGTQTFAMSGVTSVEIRKEAPNRRFLWGIFVLLSGLTLAKDNMSQGLTITAIGIGMMAYQYNKRDQFHLVLRAAGGEVTAYTNYDPAPVKIMADAITEAIVFRG